MTSTLQSWERSRYESGGGVPFLFFVVFGKVSPNAPLSRSKYRSNGQPEGLELMGYGPPKHPEVPDSFRDGFLWDELKANQPQLAATIGKCEDCMILQGSPVDETSLDYLRDAVGLITYLLDSGGCAVYDPQMFRWWSASDWKKQIFDPASAVPRNHCVILFSEEDNDSSLKWYHTRGMRKFGRPDISVHNVPAELEDGVIDMCNRFIEAQAFGLVVKDRQKVKMPSLPEGTEIRLKGDLDDPDFNNVHFEVIWPQK